jgi:hypothetical protein
MGVGVGGGDTRAYVLIRGEGCVANILSEPQGWLLVLAHRARTPQADRAVVEVLDFSKGHVIFLNNGHCAW